VFGNQFLPFLGVLLLGVGRARSDVDLGRVDFAFVVLGVEGPGDLAGLDSRPVVVRELGLVVLQLGHLLDGGLRLLHRGRERVAVPVPDHLEQLPQKEPFVDPFVAHDLLQFLLVGVCARARRRGRDEVHLHFEVFS